MEIKGRPSGLKPGKPHEVQVRVKNWHRDLVTVAGPDVERTRYGYRLKGTDDTIAMSLNFDSKALRNYRAVFPGGPSVVLPIEVVSGEEGKKFFVQLSPWEMMITRFIVKGRGGESTREFEIQGEQRQLEDYRFNDYIKLKGKLWDTWNEELYPMVKTRPQGDVAGNGRAFDTNEAVVMGWAKSEETQHTFFTAEDDPAKALAGIPSFRAEDELVVEFDLEILLDPKAQTKKSSVDDEWGLDEDIQLTDSEEQRRIWRDFQVEDFKITVHEVDPDGEDIRLKASRANGLSGPVATYMFGKNLLTNYANLKEVDRFTGEVRYEITAPVYRTGLPLRKPGFYEVRLYMKVQRGPDINDFREVDVAVRIRAVKSGFDVRVWQWTTERGR